MNEEFMKDIVFLNKGANGNIEFARFANNEKFDRKMENDTVFLKSILGANDEDEFRLKSEVTDDLGILHKRFQQYYKGIRVFDAEYLLHGRDGNIEVMNGDFQNIEIKSIEPAYNERQALEKALEYVSAKKYLWEEPKMEEYVKEHLNDLHATC